jgi:hypothetical protein
MLELALYYQQIVGQKLKKLRDIDDESRNKEATEAITLHFEYLNRERGCS